LRCLEILPCDKEMVRLTRRSAWTVLARSLRDCVNLPLAFTHKAYDFRYAESNLGGEGMIGNDVEQIVGKHRLPNEGDRSERSRPVFKLAVRG
jgi:hypothetical protein